MDQLLSGAGASAKAPPLISTDRELIIAAKALRCAFKSVVFLLGGDLNTVLYPCLPLVLQPSLEVLQ